MRLKGSYDEYLVHALYWRRNLTHQRLGQYIWNQMGKDGMSWPELFYCEEAHKVDQMVFDEYYPPSV
jgi:hypothetical protein